MAPGSWKKADGCLRNVRITSTQNGKNHMSIIQSKFTRHSKRQENKTHDEEINQN